MFRSWISPHGHGVLVGYQRTDIIRSRVRLVAGVFAVLVPAWSVIEYFTLPTSLWLSLAGARMVTALGFAAVFLLSRRSTAFESKPALAMLFVLPALFYVYAMTLLGTAPAPGIMQTIIETHVFLPLVLATGISIFPLTLAECLAILTLIFAAKIFAVWRSPPTDLPSLFASFWMLVLISAVATIAAVSQLKYVSALIQQSIRDPLTRCFSRKSGEQLLQLHFAQALRAGSPLAVAFMDIDRFKRVNDEHGHEAGDKTLQLVAQRIMERQRSGDILVRWGGEEFLLIMPNADRAEAVTAVERLRADGFGQRPEGTPLTFSIGLAERIADDASTAEALVAVADARMYQAKQSGRDRIVGVRMERVESNA